MTENEQTGSEPEVNPEAPLDVVVTFPDVINFNHIQAYNTGRKRYEAVALANGEIPDEAILSRYYGAVELIKRGYVHIENLDEVKAALDDKNKTPTPADVIAYLFEMVALAFEAKLVFPLAWKKSKKR